MIKKFAIAAVLITVGLSPMVFSEMDLDVELVKAEFYSDSAFTITEKNYIWNEAWNVIEADLSDLDFGGDSYGK